MRYITSTQLKKKIVFFYSLDSTFIANRSITINKCDFDVHYELTQCDTTVLTSECTTNNLAWVQCSLGSKFIDINFLPVCNEFSLHST